MASTPQGAALTEQHRLAQAALGRDVARLVLSAWPLLDIDDLDGTLDRWLRVVVPLVAGKQATSAALAAQYLRTFRKLEAPAAGRLAPVLAALDRAALTTSLVVTGPVAIKTALSRGVLPDLAVDHAKAGAARAAMRHALDGGRGTITAATAADPAAHGWARATSGKACGFCAMLASRGPAYKGHGTADFEAHDGCSCTAEPVYDRSTAWPAGARRYEDLWQQATAADGDTANAFRRLVEA